MCYANLWKTTLWSAEWNMGWNFIAVEEEHSKHPTNMTMKVVLSDRQRQLMTHLNDQ